MCIPNCRRFKALPLQVSVEAAADHGYLGMPQLGNRTQKCQLLTGRCFRVGCKEVITG